jgi:hypothetical protein
MPPCGTPPEAPPNTAPSAPIETLPDFESKADAEQQRERVIQSRAALIRSPRK